MAKSNISEHKSVITNNLPSVAHIVTEPSLVGHGRSNRIPHGCKGLQGLRPLDFESLPGHRPMRLPVPELEQVQVHVLP